MIMVACLRDLWKCWLLCQKLYVVIRLLCQRLYVVMLVSVSEVICGNTGFFVRGDIYIW